MNNCSWQNLYIGAKTIALFMIIFISSQQNVYSKTMYDQKFSDIENISDTKTQPNSEAAAMLDKLQNRLKSMPSYNMDICIESEYGSAISSGDMPYVGYMCGKLTISEKKFKLIGEDHEIYCDTKSIYTYDKERKEVNIETFNPKDKNNIFMNPAALLNFSSELFDIVSLSQHANIKRVMLKAKPQAKLPLEKLTLEFTNNNWWPTHIISTSTKVSSQIQGICIEITEPTATNTTGDQNFRFDIKKNPKVSVIDFR